MGYNICFITEFSIYSGYFSILMILKTDNFMLKILIEIRNYSVYMICWKVGKADVYVDEI